MRAVYAQMEREGTLRDVFRDEQVTNAGELLALMQRPGNLPVFAFWDSDLAALCWVNHMEKQSAFAHYWFARTAWGTAACTVAAEVLGYWQSFRAEEGGPLFQVLLGMTPADNRRARAFNRRIGFTEIGVVPRLNGTGMAISYRENEHE